MGQREGKAFGMLETEHLILRYWKTSDREPFAKMNADADVMRYMPKN